MKNKRNNALFVTVFVGGCLCLLFIVIAFAFFQPEPKTVDDFMQKYGGNPTVYSEILSSIDCAALQNYFDTAYSNNQTEAPGTQQHKWSLGYMAAANKRMKEINCYSP
jgi:hypothetical protein